MYSFNVGPSLPFFPCQASPVLMLPGIVLPHHAFQRSHPSSHYKAQIAA